MILDDEKLTGLGALEARRRRGISRPNVEGKLSDATSGEMHSNWINDDVSQTQVRSKLYEGTWIGLNRN